MRPSADRVREALFARLGSLQGCAVLDLFAGSGALGIEALSRGAERAVFVDRAPASLAALRANLHALEIADRARVLRGEADAMLRRLARIGARFDLVLVDPPYDDPRTARTLALLAHAGILAPGATVVLESARRAPPGEVPGLALQDQRRYGDTILTRWMFSDAETAHGEDAAMSQQRSHKVGLFAASFDPLTNGHLDLVARARRIFDELVVAVGHNISKEGTFSVEERLEILRAVLGSDSGIRITTFEGLVVDYARKINATAILRGLRAMSDFEYEFEMALMNKHLYPELDTIFMMTDQKYFYVSSSRLKELIRFGGNIEDFVPPLVAKKLREKVGPS